MLACHEQLHFTENFSLIVLNFVGYFTTYYIIFYSLFSHFSVYGHAEYF
jgi:hypothetical protein